MRKQYKSEVKFIQEKFAVSAESYSRRKVQGSSLDVAIGDDDALWGNSFSRGLWAETRLHCRKGK